MLRPIKEERMYIPDKLTPVHRIKLTPLKQMLFSPFF